MPEIPVNVDVQSSNDETLEWVRYEACCAVEGVPFTAPEVWPHLVKRFIAATADAAEVTALRQQVENLRESAETAVFVANNMSESWRIERDRREDLSLHESALRCDLERAEAERDALQARLDAVVAAGRESCREWSDAMADRCGKPADFILWGKLFPPEALGPRCQDCAEKHTRTDRWTIEQSAIFDLRPFAAALSLSVPTSPAPETKD